MSETRQVEVLIVGAGISGIGAAIRLQQLGISDLLILEKGSAVGGTWRDNTYPGCACDVPSLLYSYSFVRQPGWSRVFAGQPEIARYVQDTARRSGVLDSIRFGEDVQSASWNERERRWHIRTARGFYAARFVISCAGYLHEPQIPELPGLKEFPGEVFHSSRWKHELDLRGRRIAVIGTGASAIQFVPRIQPDAERLYVFQRTPQWILPKLDAPINRIVRTILAAPGTSALMREMLHRRLEKFGGAFRHPAHMKRVEAVALRHLAKSVSNHSLREKLTPKYVLGCKRVLLSNDYYPALTKPNVELFATGVSGIRGTTLVGIDGTERDADTIILGTGFHVSDPPIAAHIRGADGRTLAETWAGSPEAYRGTTIAGFPNAFMVLGPNLAIGHNSAFAVIEAQLAYIVSALTTLRKRGITRFEVRRDAQASYNREVQRDLTQTVWNSGGCSSYYIDANGKNSVAFPWSVARMQRILARFDLENYHASASHGSARTARSENRAHV